VASKAIHNVLMVGVGGQGIVLASDILSNAAMLAGYDVKKSEVHGMSQRGGSVFSHVRFGGKVHSPILPMGSAEILLSFEEMETLRWTAFANKETRAIVLNTRILPSGVTEYPVGIKEELEKLFSNLLILDHQVLAQKAGAPKFANVAILGLVSCYVAFPEKAWQQAIEEEVPRGTFEKNWEAFKAGQGLAPQVQNAK